MLFEYSKDLAIRIVEKKSMIRDIGIRSSVSQLKNAKSSVFIMGAAKGSC